LLLVKEGEGVAEWRNQEPKADEVAFKAARSADKVALKTSLLEELRFAKRQQMAVVTSAMALLGAILAIGNLLKPLSDGKNG
jgi:hypothetical protein